MCVSVYLQLRDVADGGRSCIGAGMCVCVCVCVCVRVYTGRCMRWQTEVWKRERERERVYREVHEMADGGVVGARVHVDPLQPYHQLPQLSPNVTTTLQLRVTSYELGVRDALFRLSCLTLTSVSHASVTSLNSLNSDAVLPLIVSWR